MIMMITIMISIVIIIKNSNKVQEGDEWIRNPAYDWRLGSGQGRFPFRKKFGNFGWKSLEMFVWEKVVQFHIAYPGAAHATRQDTKIAAELVVILDQVLADKEEEMITASDGEKEIYLMAVISTFIERKLNRNKRSYQAIRRWMC